MIIRVKEKGTGNLKKRTDLNILNSTDVDNWNTKNPCDVQVIVLFIELP